jgi:predicted TIM-barrel fold metal-dependent hydrolase
MPELDFGSAICSATNRWLAETWLDAAGSKGRFLGSIRVNPEDPEGAIAEIERWVSNPRMVQVAVPLEAHKPYGGRQYFKVWETAARYGLPVAVHSDGGAGIDFFPTPNGYPRHFIEYNTMVSMNPFYHISSLIAEGVFERLPDLKFVFADGGHDMLIPLIWRMDQDWPVSGWQIPWVSKRPSHYLQAHVRFCTTRLEGPPLNEAIVGQWEATGQLGELLMFASNYPHWSTMSPSDLPVSLSEPVRRRILGQNAAEYYGSRLMKAPQAIAGQSI